MPSPIDNEVELPPPPYPSAPEASENLGCDGQANLPGAPPTYEEATDPTFMQRFQMFSESFHPAEVSRLTRQMTSNNQDPEAMETNGRQPKAKWIACFFSCLLLLFALSFLGSFIAMIAVGSYYFEQCDAHSPLPMWLIVEGSATLGAVLFLAYVIFSRTGSSKCYCCSCILFVMPVFWFFYGCYHVFGGHNKWAYEQFSCDVPFYFAYVVVVIPLAIFGLLVARCFLKWIYKKVVVDLKDSCLYYITPPPTT